MPAAPQPRKTTRRRSPQSQALFREQLVAQAKAIYAAKGYEGLTVRAVTEAFGMSPMAFYAYFPDKQALVRTIWVDIYRGMLGALLAAGPGASPIDKVRAHAQTIIDYWESHADDFRVVYLTSTRGGRLDPGELTDEPVYSQLVALLGERLLACAHGRPVPPPQLQLLADFVRLKIFGYLFVALGLERYTLAERSQLRKMVVDDVVATVERTLQGTHPARRAAGPHATR